MGMMVAQFRLSIISGKTTTSSHRIGFSSCGMEIRCYASAITSSDTSIAQRSVQPTENCRQDFLNRIQTEKPNLPIMLQSSRQPCYESRQPGNYMTIDRDSDSIKESFLIDPSRSVPSKLLPPRTSHETKDRRNNLNLITKKGEIDADIEIIESSRTTNFRVDIRSRGDINIRLVRLFDSQAVALLTLCSIYRAPSLRTRMSAQDRCVSWTSVRIRVTSAFGFRPSAWRDH